MKAVFTIGCPGAGKTTYARTLLDADPLMMFADLDALRIAAWGGKKRYWAEPNSIASHGLDRMMLAAMETAWLMERNIVFPNTNLRPAADAALGVRGEPCSHARSSGCSHRAECVASPG